MHKSLLFLSLEVNLVYTAFMVDEASFIEKELRRKLHADFAGSALTAASRLSEQETTVCKDLSVVKKVSP